MRCSMVTLYDIDKKMDDTRCDLMAMIFRGIPWEERAMTDFNQGLHGAFQTGVMGHGC